MAGIWTQDGGEWLYRDPFLFPKEKRPSRQWKVRRRHLERRDPKTNRFVEEQISIPRDCVKPDPVGHAAARKWVEKRAHNEKVAFDKAREDPTTKPPTEITLGEAIPLWIERDIDMRGIGERSKQNILFASTLWRRYLGDGRLVLSVDYETIEDLFTNEKKLATVKDRRTGHEGKPARATAGGTRKKHLRWLDNFFAWAQDMNFTRQNPIEKLRRRPWVRALHEDKHRGQALDEGQLRRLLEAARTSYEVDTTPRKFRRAGVRYETRTYSPPDCLFIALLVSAQTGLRSGNLVGEDGLRWRDVDLAAGTMTIARELMKVKKPERGDFQVPLHDEVVRCLRGWLRRQAEVFGRLPRADDRVIVYLDRRAGEYPKRAGLVPAFENALRRSGLHSELPKKFRWHDVRHSFITRATDPQNGAHDRDAVKSLVDHLERDITGRYVHVGLDRMRAAIEKLPAIFPEEMHEILIRKAE